MSNVAVIFAGGTGQRMHTNSCPKQFLEVSGKPILVHTLEQFQHHDEIDGIVVVCLSDWLDYCQTLVDRYMLTKVAAIVGGGKNGQESIYNGVKKAAELYSGDTILLIHDGVRPLIQKQTISECISCVKKYRSAITVSPAIETIAVQNDEGRLGDIIDRSKCRLAKAPQCFYLEDIYEAHQEAIAQCRTDFIDSASLMRYYGHSLEMVEGSSENIKITTQMDFYMFRAILNAREDRKVFGF